MTIEEQIKNLKEIGLIVADEEYAKKILNDISYKKDDFSIPI
jgi:abortive infection bacteriophage resistance protein